MAKGRINMNSFLKSEPISKIVIIAASIGISLVIILPIILVDWLEKLFA